MADRTDAQERRRQIALDVMPFAFCDARSLLLAEAPRLLIEGLLARLEQDREAAGRPPLSREVLMAALAEVAALGGVARDAWLDEAEGHCEEAELRLRPYRNSEIDEAEAHWTLMAEALREATAR